MSRLANRARMTTATTGTGPVTLGVATAGFQTFAAAGIGTGDQVRYVIEDGTAWEIGLGTYTAGGTTLSRGPVASSNAGAAISLSGSAVVFVTAAAEDIAQPADVQVFSTPGPTTWVKPDGARSVEVILVGGGGGGGSGRKSALATLAHGGGGGGGGARCIGSFPAAILGATEALVVGAGGAGGAAVSASSTNGTAGAAGGASSFGVLLLAGPGGQGTGGSNTVGGNGGNAASRGQFLGTAGAAGALGNGGGAVLSNGASAGGGGGAGVNAGGSAFGGGTGGFPTMLTNGVVTAAGANGLSAPVNSGLPGCGGGGGSSSGTGNAAAGGAGGLYGGGGGGGGAALDGRGDSGKGGDGAPGIVIVITHF